MRFYELRRSLGNFAVITWNRLRGRTFVPVPRREINLETSSLCNLACRFCAYIKLPRGRLMDDALFEKALTQATGFGMSRVILTPMVGEVFADPRVREKLARLEAEPGITSVVFYTNLIMARRDDLATLLAFPKLRRVIVSVYGLDEESFCLTTRKPAGQFRKLMENLEALYDAYRASPLPGGLSFDVRTLPQEGDDFFAIDKPAVRLLAKFRELDGVSFSIGGEYDSWGGAIDQSEVDMLGIEITQGERIYKYGACTKLFNETRIAADGKVRACACRDADGSLIVGDLNEAPLPEILSMRNDRYRSIVEGQMRGEFLPNCRACSVYRSIYDHRPSVWWDEALSYEEACERLG